MSHLSARIFKANILLFVISLVAVLAIAAWTYYRLKVVLPRITQEAIAADRARLAARPLRPVIDGEPTEDNAGDPYGPVLRSVQKAMKAPGTGRAYGNLHIVALDGPWPPKRPESATEMLAAASKLLDRHRSDVAAVRAGVRARRDWSRWQLKFRIDDPLAGQALSNLLILAGHEKARANEFHEAAVRYLESVRFSWDLAEEPGDLGSGMLLGQEGLHALGVVVTSGSLPDAELGWIKASLDRLKPTMPVLAESVRHQWVGWALFCSPEKIPTFHAMMAGMGEPVSGPMLLLACARGIGELAPLFEEASRAASITDPQNAERRLRVLYQSDAVRALPMVQVMEGLSPESIGIAGFLGDSLVQNLTMRARFALVKSAIRVEEKRGKDGRYPADVTGLMATDPFAKPGVRLRYAVEPSGRGYKLWSLGEDYKDDGGANSDVVLRRTEARTFS